jgi:hypothetical protein
MSSLINNNKNRLQYAVDELVQATLKEVESTSVLTIANDAVSELKKINNNINIKTDELIEISKKIEEGNVKKINVDINVSNIIQKQNRIQLIQWAITNSNYCSFDYILDYKYDSNNYRSSSTDLIRKILFSFMKNQNYCIPENAIILPTEYYQKSFESFILIKSPTESRIQKGHRDFLINLEDQLFSLLGCKTKSEETGGRLYLYNGF